MNKTHRQDQFLRWLDETQDTLGQGRKLKAEQGEEFEAVLDRIRANVAQTFRPLFVASIEQAYSVAPSDPQMRSILEADMSKEERHPLIFSYLLEKVSGSWIGALEEATRHNDQEAVIKERAKLEIAERIRAKFRALYPEVRTNEGV